jgi:hypothetical protein
VGWRILGGVAAALAGIAARRAMMLGWKTTTRKEPPSNPESPDTQWSEAIAWAVASGALMGLARMLATRKAAEYYRRSTGHLPNKMEEVA